MVLVVLFKKQRQKFNKLEKDFQIPCSDFLDRMYQKSMPGKGFISIALL
jgi:hypothetical protein